jgi:hypothetical protein
MIDTSAVALISTCQLLPIPGRAKRIICGNSTRTNTCRRFMP